VPRTNSPEDVRSQALTGLKLAAPLIPGTVFCAGANYKDHVEEMSRAFNLPPEPDPHELGLRAWHFVKPARNCVRGPGDSVHLPRWAKFIDWEAEIAMVIGREARDVSVAEAMRYVAGFTIVNDLSARDQFIRKGVQENSPFRYDWISQKCFDGALPLGPWITPAADVADPSNLKIKLWVNDELMQDSSSNQLVFDMAEQVAHLSERLTLRPGDVIATGTPAGCGLPRGRTLRPGDAIRIWVEAIGELHHALA
jgi:2-keto-4-pentenoate hydratase/2-oxohepta-3-ene-1,7-dioic acid hydratase in catechol pathway